MVDVSDHEILAARGPKNQVDSSRPYAFFVERERTTQGRIDDVATVFLTNRECPWRCVYCDLWKNTTDETVAVGAIPAQIDYALERLPPARHIKLYNSGNFFDARAIPSGDHESIAARVRHFETVVIENHPKLCGETCLRFRERLGTALEIALGLETVHPQVLPRLNKGLSLDDFTQSVELLLRHGIAVRAFVLLRPPFLSEAEGVRWAIRSIDFALGLGIGCVTVIPVRGGNGIMERLERDGQFSPPRLRSLEQVLDAELAMNRGRVFVDLWDAARFYDCSRCGPARVERLAAMNLSQQMLPRVECDCGT